MASGTKTVKITEYDNLIFSWEETAQSIANNTTTVAWAMKIQAIGSSGKISSNVKKPWKVVVNGTEYSGSVSHGVGANETKTLASGSTTIKHNTDGTKTFSYSFMMTFEGLVFSGVAIGNKSGSGTGTLTKIPRQATLTAAPNFDDEANPKITYNNPAGTAVSTLEACIADSEGKNIYVPYRALSKSGTSYTFNLTTAERETLRNATPNSNTLTVKFYIKTIIGGETYYSSLAKTLSIVNALPSLSATVIDEDSAMIALTGNANTLVKGYSDAKCGAAAIAQKGATMVSYKISCGDGRSNTYSAGGIIGGTFTNVDSGTFTFTATDSRGNTAKQTITKTLVNYIKLTNNLDGNMITDGTLTLNTNGNYFNGTIGATANTLTIQYRYKAKDGTYSSWAALTASKSGNTYTATGTITGLDYRTTYVIQTRAIDKIRTVNSKEITINAFPVFDWSETDFNFNVPVYITDDTSSYNILGLAKAVSKAYSLPTTISAGTNYSSVKGSNAILCGNMLRCNIDATRSSNTGTGNITNETVATLSINHGGKIKTSYTVSFCSGITGGASTFSITNTSNDGTTLTFDVVLAATTVAGSTFTAYWVIPCAINLDAY